MNQQEEIREGIARNLPQSKLCFRCGEVVCDTADGNDICKVQFRIADKILEDEHSQGVVIKVDRDLPGNYQEHIDCAPSSAKREMETPSDLFIFYKGAIEAQQVMLGSDYVAVEPLIKGD